MASQYIILPRIGDQTAQALSRGFLLDLPMAASTSAPVAAPATMFGGHEAQIIDSINEDGPKLAELSDEAAEAANRPNSPVRAVPLVIYEKPDPRPRAHSHAVTPAAAVAAPFVVEVTDSTTGAPLPGADVVAFEDFDNRIGVGGVTDATGRVSLQIFAPTIERLYVYGPTNYWGGFRSAIPATGVISINDLPIDLGYVDAVRDYYPASNFAPGVGVRVGIIDSGVGPHGDLNLVGGSNTVTGEPALDFHDGGEHGTHVAGLVGSNNVPPAGLRGVAPGVELMSYRVFGAGAGGASNYAILKAMIRAAMDNCDIINLSLGGGPADPIVREAIADAREQGMLVIIAAGNDGRQPVAYPAAHPGAVAVSAMGKDGTFPTGSVYEGDVLRPPSSAQFADEFIASFSNIGADIAVTGPGVGVLSTLPHNTHGPMSGTSMAAPVVAGAAACLLSQNPAIYGLPRDHKRAAAMEKLLQTNCVKRGFGLVYEGFGLPDPAVV